MHGLYRKNQLSAPEEHLCTNAFWRKNLFSRYEIKPKYFNVPTYHVKDNTNECFERVSKNSWYDTSSFRKKKGAFLFSRELRHINWNSSHDGVETNLSDRPHDGVEAPINGALPMLTNSEDAKNLDECGSFAQNVVSRNANGNALNDKTSNEKEKKKKKALPLPNDGVTPTGSLLTFHARKNNLHKLAKMGNAKRTYNVKNEKWTPESCRSLDHEPAQRYTHKWDTTPSVSGKVYKKKQTSIDLWKYKREDRLKGCTLHEQVNEKIISSKLSAEKGIMCVHKLATLPVDDKMRSDKSGKGQLEKSSKKMKEKSVHRKENLGGLLQMTPSMGKTKKESFVRSYITSEIASVSVIASGGYTHGGKRIEEKNTPMGQEQIRDIFHPTGNSKSMTREIALRKGTYTTYQQKGRRHLGMQKMLLSGSSQGEKSKEGGLEEGVSGMPIWNCALESPQHGEDTPPNNKRITNSLERTSGVHTEDTCSLKYSSKERTTTECMMIEDVDVNKPKLEEEGIIGLSTNVPGHSKNLHLLDESSNEKIFFDSLVNSKMYFRIDFKIYKPILMRAITQVRVYSNEKLLQCVYIKEYPQKFSVVVQNAVRMCNGKVLAKMKNKLINIKETGVLNFTYLNNKKVIGCSHISIRHVVSSGVEGGLFIPVDDHADCRKQKNPKEAFVVDPLLPFGRQEINVLKSKIFVNYKIDCPRSMHDFIASGEVVTAKAKISFLEDMVRQMYNFIQDSVLLRFVKGARRAHGESECGTGNGEAASPRVPSFEYHALKEAAKVENEDQHADGEKHLYSENPGGRSGNMGNAPEGGGGETEDHLPIGNAPQNGEREDATDRKAEEGKDENEAAEKSKSTDLEEGGCNNTSSSNHTDPPPCDGIATGNLQGEAPNSSNVVEDVLKLEQEDQGTHKCQQVDCSPDEGDNPHVESTSPGKTYNENAENNRKGNKDEVEQCGTNRYAPKGVPTYTKGLRTNYPFEQKNKKKQIEQLESIIAEYKKELVEKGEEIQKLKHSNNNTNILYKACYRKLQEIENERKRTDAMNFLLRFDDSCSNKLTNRLDTKKALPRRKAYTETDTNVLMGPNVRRVNSLRTALVALNGEENNMGGNAIRRSGTGTFTGSSTYTTTMRSLPPMGKERLNKKKQTMRTESVNRAIMDLFDADLGENFRFEKDATPRGTMTDEGDHCGERRVPLSNYQIKEKKIDALVKENESLKERINKLTLTDAEWYSRIPPLRDVYSITRAKDKSKAQKYAKLRGVEQHCTNSNYLEHSWGEKKKIYNYAAVRNKYSSNSRFNFPLNLVKSYSNDPIAHRDVDIYQSGF
ncbi:Uncharacterized protein PCOAH_00033360 [Plasmodium coatneyi]|uniref:Uncharacterized protein n=1 Tax=Plasmodium coatneyi TaxID=208452 RepID=A0A1B1E249_9APIC|nr:Uncharacterized protein PCOAH_00033360 [Plasmodium coatneyi]ANQ09122.1 Uncharacterized protein PCOAH_00033360 [Plasmodium coatneyi]